MINFIKGIFVGIFNIIPGLSGSALLIILNLYEKCIEAISNIFKKPKENFLFLLPIGLGIIIGTFIFSKIILLLINKYPTSTFIVFTGFLIGTLPHLFKECNKTSLKIISNPLYNSNIIRNYLTIIRYKRYNLSNRL